MPNTFAPAHMGHGPTAHHGKQMRNAQYKFCTGTHGHGTRLNDPSWQTIQVLLHSHIVHVWVQFRRLHPLTLTRRWTVGAGILGQLCFPGHERRVYHGQLKIQREWGLCAHTRNSLWLQWFWRSVDGGFCFSQGNNTCECFFLRVSSFSSKLHFAYWYNGMKEKSLLRLESRDEFMSCVLTKGTVSRCQIESLSRLVPNDIL